MSEMYDNYQAACETQNRIYLECRNGLSEKATYQLANWWKHSAADIPMIKGKPRKMNPKTLIGADRRKAREDALEFVRLLLDAPIEKIALENPVGCIGTRIRPADQFIQPYEYGEDASKRTGLWLKNLPKLQPNKFIKPRYVDGKPRWANQTDSGQNKEPPSDDRWKTRAKTYDGWAKAMAEQWGNK